MQCFLYNINIHGSLWLSLRCSHRGGGTSSNVWLAGSVREKRTQLDIRFCENERSQKIKIIVKGCQLDRKLTLGPSISGTKCDRDKPIISTERGGQSYCVEVSNRDSIGLKMAKTGVITAEPPYHVQVWEYPPQGCSYIPGWHTDNIHV